MRRSRTSPAAERAAAGRRLNAAGIVKVFGEGEDRILALAGVDLAIEPGEFVCLLGPSGCGKSTLLSIMAGLAPATAGTVTVGSEAVTGPLVEAGVMFQRDLLLDWRSCEDNILLQFQMRGQGRAEHVGRARDLLRLVGMGEFAASKPRALSGGMRQRVAICRALVHDPPFLFLDEPFGALDALTRESLNFELGQLTASAEASVALVTHSLDEAVFLGDRVIVISPRPGRVIAEVAIELPRPRENRVRSSPEFVAYTAQLRELLTEQGTTTRSERG